MTAPTEIFAGFISRGGKDYGINVSGELIAAAIGLDRLTSDTAEIWIRENYPRLISIAVSQIPVLRQHGDSIVIRLRDAWW